jgi:phosphoadenosine phosphosulfate reductase
MLIDHTLFGVVDKVAIAIERLKAFKPPEGYYGAFSGGKDSVTIKRLAQMAGVKVDWHYSLTTVDPPELVQFIKREHGDVIIERPKKTMWQLIPHNLMPPTRLARYCCRILKEGGGEGRVVITGIRQQESVKRSKRQMVEQDRKDKTKTYLNPIIDWSESDVWEFIRGYGILYCSLYDEDFTRLGCIGCPMAGTKGQLKDFTRWPKYRAGYLRAFEKMIQEQKKRGKEPNWHTGEEVMAWWLQMSGRGGISQCNDDQTVMFE